MSSSTAASDRRALTSNGVRQDVGTPSSGLRPVLTRPTGRVHYAPMDTHDATSVVVVPRERVGSAIESLERVLSTMRSSRGASVL
jgi:hypothetical protein